MNSSDLIDDASQHVLNKGEASVGDADTRARILFHAQTAAKKRWNKRQWWFRATSATVVIQADTGSGDLPLDFSSFGKDGFLMNPAARGAPLVWLPPNRLLKMLELNAGPSKVPRYYTLHGRALDVAQAPIGGLQVFRAPNVDVDMTIYYDMSAPVLTEDPETDGLWKFPADFHESVLFVDVRAALMADEGDTRSTEYEQKADRADAEMWAEHTQGRHVARGSPRYGAGVIRR